MEKSIVRLDNTEQHKTWQSYSYHKNLICDWSQFRIMRYTSGFFSSREKARKHIAKYMTFLFREGEWRTKIAQISSYVKKKKICVYTQTHKHIHTHTHTHTHTHFESRPQHTWTNKNTLDSKYVLNIAQVWISLPNVGSQTRCSVHSPFTIAEFLVTQQIQFYPPFSLPVSPHYFQSLCASSE